jgi:signal transduction histidine kinase
MKASDLSTAGTVLFPFLRALAHDMAAPLTSTLGYAQINLDMPGSATEIQDDFKLIEESAQDLSGKVGLLGRLSRYMPTDTNCPAVQLMEDLEVLTVSLAQSAGGNLQWTLDESLGEVGVQGNPWLLRVACLALLGSICKYESARVTVSCLGDFVVLEFPPPDTEPEVSAPDQWGCATQGVRLLESQSAVLEKGDDWRLRFPVAAEPE